MSATFDDAFAKVEGRAFDLAVGFAVPQRPHRPVDPQTAVAFAGIDYERDIGWVARALARRFDGRFADAEEATHEVFVELLAKNDEERLHKSPAEWGSWLYWAAYRRLVRMLRRGGQVESLERLREVGGDAALDGAEPCVPIALASDDRSRHVPPPGKGEAWTWTQIVGALQRFRDYYGRPPTARECRRVNGLPSLTAIYKHFGRFSEAVLAAGMHPRGLGRRTRRWTALEAADVCRRFRKWNGRWPDGRDAERHPGVLPGREAMIRFFGGTRAGEVQLGAEAILAA